MKTAVEWLEEMFNNSEIPNSSMLFKQAKEMEKKQIKDSYEKGKKYKKPIKDSNPIWLNSKPYK